MTRRSYTIAAALLLLVAFGAFIPLRTVVSGDQITARKVEGIIWDDRSGTCVSTKYPLAM